MEENFQENVIIGFQTECLHTIPDYFWVKISLEGFLGVFPLGFTNRAALRSSIFFRSKNIDFFFFLVQISCFFKTRFLKLKGFMQEFVDGVYKYGFLLAAMIFKGVKKF